MKNTIFKLRENVDIYKIGEDILYFYFINKREGINISVNEPLIELVSLINGEKSINDILTLMNMEYSANLEMFLKYLLEKGIIYIPAKENKNIISLDEQELYSRQLVFFQEYLEKNPYKFQKELSDKKVLIFGVGAIGSGIAIELAMMGVKKFIFIDKGKIRKSSKVRHYYYKEKNIGKYKVEALKEYMSDIDENIEVEIFNEGINYDSDLEKYFKLNPTFIINTLDEPYIGVTSLKIGRETYKRKLPLYVAGGFDGHLMSTGELIIPDKTPCVDCYINHFTESLKGWKPNYNKKAIEIEDENIFEVGGLPSMSLFSISYAVIEIMKYFANIEYLGKGRGELLFENLEINYLKVEKNKNCIVCGERDEI